MIRTDPSDLRQVLELGAFRFGDSDGGSRTLLYSVRAKAAPKAENVDPYEIKTWYDPVTFRLLKRAVEPSDRRLSTTEVYENFALNADIPDEKFKVPEEKK